MTSLPYFKLGSFDRTAVARRYVGAEVRLIVDRARNGVTFTHTGKLISAARLDHGSTSDVLVLRTAGWLDVAFSGAIIRAIEPISRTTT